MPLKTKPYVKEPTKFEEKGYLARIVQVVDMGKQEQGEYKGKPNDPAYDVLVTFEFSEVRNDNGQPCWLSKRFKLPAGWPDKTGIKNNSNLFKFFNTFFPQTLTQSKFSDEYYFFSDDVWEMMLDTPAYLEIKLSKAGNPNIVSVGKVPSFAGNVPALENKSLLFLIGESNVEEWKQLFGWVQKLLLAAVDEETSSYAQMLAAEALKLDEASREPEPSSPDEGDDVPF